MFEILIAISVFLFCSNLFFLFLYYKSKKKPEVTLTKDANDLLGELMSGGAVCIVQVANPSEIFMYSPKDIK